MDDVIGPTAVVVGRHLESHTAAEGAKALGRPVPPEISRAVEVSGGIPAEGPKRAFAVSAIRIAKTVKRFQGPTFGTMDQLRNGATAVVACAHTSIKIAFRVEHHTDVRAGFVEHLQVPTARIRV